MALIRQAIRKRVVLPQGSAVYVPVLKQVPFSVAQDQYQERIIHFRNDATSRRGVHVHNVPSSDNSSTIAVERIDSLPVTTAQEQYQESRFHVTNVDPPPVQANGANNPAHERVHYVRYYQDNDVNSGIWVDIELIDRLKVILAQEQYQEYMLYLQHDALGATVNDPEANYGPITVGTCDLTLERAPIDAELDPPYRLDLFQNIIRFGEEGTAVGPSDVVYIAPIGTVDQPPSDNMFGMWVKLTDQSGDYTSYDDTIVPHYLAGDIDFRHVEQYFLPHTYDLHTPIGEPDTSVVRGYTDWEWEAGFYSNPPIFPNSTIFQPDYHPNWLDQLEDYNVANAPASFTNGPHMFDFVGYGFSGMLGGFYDAFHTARTTTDPPWPFPYVRARMTAIGPITTDNPWGRY